MNQGARGARAPGAHSRANTAVRGPRRRASHALFHPDCDRRLWHRTRSADPGGPRLACQALAGCWPESQIPPVGNFAPP